MRVFAICCECRDNFACEITCHNDIFIVTNASYALKMIGPAWKLAHLKSQYFINRFVRCQFKAYLLFADV